MRMLQLIFLILLYQILKIDCTSDEFVTVWTPNKMIEQNYRLFIKPSNMDYDKRTEFTVNFRRNVQTIALNPDWGRELFLFDNNRFRSKKYNNMTMILSRNFTNKAHPQCIDRTINIEAVKRPFHIFIQLDKPIYKPGDEIKYRVIVVDRDLKPFRFNNMVLNFIDPMDKVWQTFGDSDRLAAGVMTNTFKLSENSPLGNWKMSVMVDRQEEFIVSKTFMVEKFELAEFSAHIHAKDNNILTNSVLSLSIHAKNSLGDYVRGDAVVTIRDLATGRVYLTKSYKNIEGIKEDRFGVIEDLRINTKTQLELEARLEFTEQETGFRDTKTTKIFIQPRYKIIVQNPKTFIPGSPYRVNVYPSSWNGEAILNHFEDVEINFRIKHRNGYQTTQFISDERIRDGVATRSFIVPQDARELQLEVNFIHATYYEKINISHARVPLPELVVQHSPESREIGDIVDIFVRSLTEMENIIAVVTSRFGNTEFHQIDCNSDFSCRFNITINSRMAPKATVYVYYIQDQGTIYQGSTEIEIKNLGSNFLNIDVQKSANIGDRVRVTISGKPRSQVYLMAYDSRLSSLSNRNEVTKEEIFKDIANFDGRNTITVLKMDNWRDCTDDEVKIIDKGRVQLTSHSGSMDEAQRFKRSSSSSIYEDRDFDDFEEDEEVISFDELPDTWIFDNFTIDEHGETSRYYRVPDSTTKWRISAFAMNTDHGLAIADPKELTVKKDFFIKIILPYSIRYKEVLRVDVLVFNYMDGGSSVDVEVKMHRRGSDEFQFVDYDSNCAESYNSSSTRSKRINVDKNNMKKVSFYIRPYSNKFTFPDRIQIMVDARASNGKNYAAKKYLKVEPIGIKVYEVRSKSLNLRPGHDINLQNYEPLRNRGIYPLPKYSVIINAENNPDVTVMIKNDRNFTQTVRITKDNSHIKHEIELPDYSLEPNVTASGSGFCMIAIQTEKTVKVNVTSNSIQITAKPLGSGRGRNEEIVEVCATYTPMNNESTSAIVYDIDIPGGYQYVEIANLRSIRDQLKGIVPMKKNSHIRIYYNAFRANRKYCVQVRVRKVLEVRDSRSAGVIVFDYNNKDLVAVAYYKLATTGCA